MANTIRGHVKDLCGMHSDLGGNGSFASHERQDFRFIQHLLWERETDYSPSKSKGHGFYNYFIFIEEILNKAGQK